MWSLRVSLPSNLALNPKFDVNEMFNRARRDIVKDILADLNDRDLLILKAAISTPDWNSFVFAFIDCKLLPQRNVFNDKTGFAAKLLAV